MQIVPWKWDEILPPTQRRSCLACAVDVLTGATYVARIRGVLWLVSVAVCAWCCQCFSFVIVYVFGDVCADGLRYKQCRGWWDLFPGSGVHAGLPEAEAHR